MKVLEEIHGQFHQATFQSLTSQDDFMFLSYLSIQKQRHQHKHLQLHSAGRSSKQSWVKFVELHEGPTRSSAVSEVGRCRHRRSSPPQLHTCNGWVEDPM